MLSLATKFVPERAHFETALRSGFRAAEFWLDAKLLTDADRIARLAEDYPFRYALHFPNAGPLSQDVLQATASLYRELECTAIIIHQPMFDRYAKGLLEIDVGLNLAIENHALDLVGVDRWAEHSPGLTLDVEHLWKFTLEDAPLATLLKHVDRLLERHAVKLHHVHLPGYQPGGEEHHPIHHNEQMAAEVLTRLAAHGFSNLVVSEAEVVFQEAEFLEKDIAFYERWAKLSHANG